MRIEEALRGLAGDLEWTAVFDLARVGETADPAVLRPMFILPPDCSFNNASHVALTPGLSLIARGERGPLIGGDGSPAPAPAPGAPSLFDVYEPILRGLDWRNAVCVGIGRTPPFGPVALAVNEENGELVGSALFEREPDGRHYELLDACGVRLLGGVPTTDGRFLVRFHNTLAHHIVNGLLAGFSRTGNCNLFFLRHGDIDATLEAGLLEAGRARIAGTRMGLGFLLLDMAREFRETAPAMIQRPPPPAAPRTYGDLVPAGILAAGLGTIEDVRARAAVALVRRRLRERKKDGLWAFHTDTLPTATDTSLILLGIDDAEATEALERFSDGRGGYVPQLTADEDRPGHMRRVPERRHWEGTDYATTCLVRRARRRVGLPERTPVSWIAERFERRRGLFLANPYLVDWVTALALEGDPSDVAAELRARLADEVTAAFDPARGFGRFDPALSTAAAILALTTAGRAGRLVRCAQVRLLDMVDDTGQFPASTPFFSSLILKGESTRVPGLVRVGSGWHVLTLYQDAYSTITTSLALMALSRECDPAIIDLPEPGSVPHPRYRAKSTDYIGRFALAPEADEP